MGRRIEVYIEFIVLTVLSIVTANLWLRFISKTLDKYRCSLKIELITAIVFSAIAILFMKYIYSSNYSEPEKENEYIELIKS